MRPIGRKQPALTTVVAAGVLVVASMLAGRGQAGEPTEPVDASLAVESGSGAAPIADRADELPSLPQLPAISVARAEVKKPKGTPKLQPSALDHPDIPVTALVAYRAAATVMERADASCGLSWTLIAAIGRVESDHGRYAGAQLLPDGTSSPAIRGVALDGTGPVARIQDTDSGRLDGDSVWDRAVGPMQFLPSTWSVMGVDADGDGVRSPDDLNDAALATAVFLCTGDGDLGTADDLRAAILRYNPSSAYVASVLAVDRSYRGGDFDSLGGLLTAEPVQLIAAARFNEPSDGGGRGRSSDGNRPPRGGADRDDDRGDRGAGRDNDGDRNSEPTADPDSDPTGTPGPGPSPTPDPTTPPSPTPDPTDPPSPSPEPSPDPTDPPSPTPDPTDPPVPTPDPTDPPSPTPDPTDPPSPTPEPSPEPTPIVELAGVLAACGADQAQWCVGEQLLDVGDAAVLAAPATSDLDGDGTRESSAQELAGLSGSPVTVLTVPGTDPAVVVAINGADYAARP